MSIKDKLLTLKNLKFLIIDSKQSINFKNELMNNFPKLFINIGDLKISRIRRTYVDSDQNNFQLF